MDTVDITATADLVVTAGANIAKFSSAGFYQPAVFAGISNVGIETYALPTTRDSALPIAHMKTENTSTGAVFQQF